MTRIDKVTSSQGQGARKLLIVYITAGDPSLAITEKLVYAFEKAGADIIELGVPFSDPLADGPIIQASHQRALKNKTSLSKILALVKKIRKKSEIPIVLMAADNLIMQYGENFEKDAVASGVDGLIIPDLPPEETGQQANRLTSQQAFEPVSLSARELDHIYLVAPTSTDERIKMICDASTGFVYLVSIAGITGLRKNLSADISSFVARVRKCTDKPLCVGFGISNPKQAQEIAQFADGVIVGSAIVDILHKKGSQAAIKLVASLRKAINA